jgi:hypothetical protein
MPYKVWKFPLKAQMHQKVTVPRGANVLSAVNQGDDIVLYADIYPERYADPTNMPTEELDVIALGTGHECDHNLASYDFLSTVPMPRDGLVFHIYVRRGKWPGD